MFTGIYNNAHMDILKRIVIENNYICIHFIVVVSVYRKLSEVEVAGPPEATEALVNKINTEHVSVTYAL